MADERIPAIRLAYRPSCGSKVVRVTSRILRIASFAGAAPLSFRLDYGARVTPPLERYLQIRSAYAEGALPGGELGYLSDVTGIFQLWQVAADGLHDQLTFASERVTAALPSPTEQHWVIARDVGGNERHQLIRVDSEGQELALTDDAEAIHDPGAFSPDGARFAFAHTGRNGTDFDVALVGLDGQGRRELAQPGGYCAVVDWSDAGILVAQLASPFDHHLFLLDPDGDGTLQRLTPEQRDGEIAFSSATLLADGSVLCSCDLGSEFDRLALLRDGQVELLSPDDADVEQVLTDRRADAARLDGQPRRLLPSCTSTASGSRACRWRRSRAPASCPTAGSR